MVSFHKLKELFLLSHFHGYLNDEELLLLYVILLCYAKNTVQKSRFSLQELHEDMTRRHDIPLLAEVLQIPDSFTCYQRSVASGMEALA